MKCIVAIESRFVLSNGRPASLHLTYERFWQRYLSIFKEVIVVGRLFPVEDASAASVEGSGVKFFPLPAYVGPVQYLAHYTQIMTAINSLNLDDTAVILRLPGAVGSLVWTRCRRLKHPYGIEMVGDPFDVFAPSAVRHPLRPLFRYWFVRELKQQALNATTVSYVTAEALQRRYSTNKNALTIHYSSVDLPEDAYCTTPRAAYPQRAEFQLITVGTLAQMYKAVDVLIEAVYRCRGEGLNLSLTIIGDGEYRKKLESLVLKLRLGASVHFTGRLPAGKAIQNQLDQADIFILPSRQEGLPRAMIEAMARGLPCIGSTVGGIPELLAAEDMIPPNDIDALVRKIQEVVRDPHRMERMSARNLEKAQDYRKDILTKRREQFYQHVKETTELWVKNHR